MDRALFALGEADFIAGNDYCRDYDNMTDKQVDAYEAGRNAACTLALARVAKEVTRNHEAE